MVAGSWCQEHSLSPIGGRGYANANGSRRKIRAENLVHNEKITIFAPIIYNETES
jgi:hypothetical protein